jgi:hypothetical protein
MSKLTPTRPGTSWKNNGWSQSVRRMVPGRRACGGQFPVREPFATSCVGALVMTFVPMHF